MSNNDSSDTIDGTRIFFMPSPVCTTESLFKDFSEFGLLDYVYAIKAKKGNEWFGYARYVNKEDAEVAIGAQQLKRYKCRPAFKLTISQREMEDPSFQKLITCVNCCLSIETKLVAKHFQICEWQKNLRQNTDGYQEVSVMGGNDLIYAETNFETEPMITEDPNAGGTIGTPGI